MNSLNKNLKNVINTPPIPLDIFLESMSLEDRVIFLRRYWFCDTYAEIASRFGITERKVKRHLRQTKDQMSTYLGQPWGSYGINLVNAKYVREAEKVTILKPQRMYLFQNNSMLTDFADCMLRKFVSIMRISTKPVSMN